MDAKTTRYRQIAKLLRQASKVKSKRAARLLRGKFEKALLCAKLSDGLLDSALRHFAREVPKGLPY